MRSPANGAMHLALWVALGWYAAADAQKQGSGDDREARVGGEDPSPAHEVGDGAANGHAQPLTEE